MMIQIVSNLRPDKELFSGERVEEVKAQEVLMAIVRMFRFLRNVVGKPRGN
jgi:hypothetical protein